MSYKSIVYTIVLLLCSTLLFGQNDYTKFSYQQLRDSLVKLNFPKTYAEAYIKKAKKDQNITRLAYGYENMVYAVTPKEALVYCDSLLEVSTEIENKNYPALAYMLKGYFLYELGKDKDALEAYLTAYDYAKKNNHIAQKNEIEEFIGAMQLNLGQYKDALKIFKKRYVNITSKPNYKQNHRENYLFAIDDLSSCYLRAKMLDSAKIRINEGLLFSLQIKDSSWYRSFLSKSAFNLYFKNNYKRALDSFLKVEAFTKKPIHLSMNYYYQGKIHQKLGNTNLGIEYFNKVDSIYNKNGNPYLELKDMYKILFNYHSKKKNKIKQLYAINKFVEVDSILDDLSTTVNSTSLTDYEIPKLKEEKEKLIKELNKEHNKTNYILIIAIIVSLVLILILIKLYTDKKKVKTRFETIIQKQDTNSNSVIDKAIETPSEKPENTLNISREVIDSIMQTLTQFENNKDYLDNQITLASLAKQFNTNSVYLSKVINHYKGMSFSNYLSNLRIEYCIAELRENYTLRNYTIKAIAQEMGFRNSESFSKAFKKETDLNPSYYIKALNKLEEKRKQKL